MQLRDNAQLGKHKEMNKVQTHLADQKVFSSSLFNLYRFCRFQLLLDNAHFFVLPKVDFVFSGPHLLGFKDRVRVEILDKMLTTVSWFQLLLDNILFFVNLPKVDFVFSGPIY